MISTQNNAGEIIEQSKKRFSMECFEKEQMLINFSSVEEAGRQLENNN